MEGLRRTLEGEYEFILINVPLYRKKRRKWRQVGEIDLLAKRGEKYDVYEVKCSRRVTKAKMQLEKIKKNIPFEVGEIFFYCGSSSSLMKM